MKLMVAGVFSEEELLKDRDKKRKERGGFKDGIMRLINFMWI